MSVSVITPPDALVSLEEVKQHLRIEENDTAEDLLLAVLIGAAQGTIDGPDGWVGRSFGVQTLEWRGSGFDEARSSGIQLPCPPVIEVLSVSVRGLDGTAAILLQEAYQLGSDGMLAAAVGQVWPRSDCRADAVVVRYRAGYAEDDLPVRVKQAIMIMVAAMYENRLGAADIQNSATIHGLLGGLRVWQV